MDSICKFVHTLVIHILLKMSFVWLSELPMQLNIGLFFMIWPFDLHR